MKKYIALLRGINVGGKNKISMSELKKALDDIGFTNVSTYINSGNIVFTSTTSSKTKLTQQFEAVIKDSFDLDIAVFIMLQSELEKALLNVPGWWDNDSESKHNAIFVLARANTEDVLKSVGDAKPEYEKVFACGSVIFWSAPIKTFSKTRWSKVSGSATYASITIRNANTTKKLIKL